MPPQNPTSSLQPAGIVPKTSSFTGLASDGQGLSWGSYFKSVKFTLYTGEYVEIVPVPIIKKKKRKDASANESVD